VQKEPPAPELSDEFKVIGDSPPDIMIELMFFVKIPAMQVKMLHDTLMNVSDPGSSSYGQHLSNNEVHSMSAPLGIHVSAVKEHLSKHNVDSQCETKNCDLVSAIVSIKDAEDILATRYTEISNVRTGKRAHRCLQGYHLPADVAVAVDMVTPTVHIMTPTPMKRHATEYAENGASNNSAVCPDKSGYATDPKALRALYSVAGAVGQNSKNKQAVTGFLEQTFSMQALEDYWSLYCEGLMCGKGVPGCVGGQTMNFQGEAPGVEAMLDINVITGVAGNVHTEFWGFAGRSKDNSENEPFLKWLIRVSQTSDEVVPKVFSVSYGEDENSWSSEAENRLNTEFIKMGLRGISVLFASGDFGANLKNGSFVPLTPGSSPYVTAVGALAGTPGFPLPGAETGTALSSGGFSNRYAMPEWQVEAVSAYLGSSVALPDFSEYSVNTSGRAYPDISAQGYSFCVTPQFVQGVDGCIIGGTSAATPTVSGIISLLNDLRATHGKKPLGFLNPLIYKHPEVFNDITTGYNTLTGGCDSDPAWPCTSGWDAVSGMGSPNYAKLAELVTKLP
jgi:tripeptidyl-peptidase-1